MRYSIEPRDRIYVKWYGFLSLAKNMGTHATKVAENLCNKYGHKPLDSAKISTTDAIKTASKRAIQKTAEATGVLIGNKIADKITSVSKKSHNELQNDKIEVGRVDPKDIPKKIHISRRKKANYWWIKVSTTI